MTPTTLFQIDPPWASRVDPSRLDRAVQATLRHEAVPDEATLALVVVGDEAMTRLHEQYRGEAGTTDVLTFPYEDLGLEEEMATYLGDVILCYEQAARQAEAEGHSVQEELELLAVHGTLHLLGYDDETVGEKERMWAAQHTILTDLGLSHVAP